MGIFDRLFFGGFGSPQKNQRAAQKSRAMDSPLPLILPPISTPAPIPTPIPIRNIPTPTPAPAPRIQPRPIAPGITPSAYDRDIVMRHLELLENLNHLKKWEELLMQVI